MHMLVPLAPSTLSAAVRAPAGSGRGWVVVAAGGMADQWRAREDSRAAERKVVQMVLGVLRRGDAAPQAIPRWEKMSRCALVRARALALVSLCDDMLEASMDENQAVALLLTAERVNGYQMEDIRQAIDKRSQDRHETAAPAHDTPQPKAKSSSSAGKASEKRCWGRGILR